MALGVFRYVLMKPAFESSINKAHLTTPLIVVFNDRTKLNEVVVEYPIGHARRRTEEISLLHEKFKRNLSRILRKVSVAGPSSILRSLFIL
jgi:2-methylcitrate dehydratase PrpD